MEVARHSSRADLPALARTCKAICVPVQEVLFSSHIVFRIADQDDACKSSPQELSSFLFALIETPALRKHVRSLEFDFGCYCFEVENEDDEPAFEAHELKAVREMSQLWLHLPWEEKRVLYGLDDLFSSFHDYWGSALEVHLWYARVFALILCFTPKLRTLELWSREWDTDHPHGHRAFAELDVVAKYVYTQNLLPELEDLTLQSWAWAVEWNTGLHPFGAFISLKSLKHVTVDDILCEPLRPHISTAPSILIAAIEATTRNDGARLLTPYSTESHVHGFLKRAPKVQKLGIEVRDTLYDSTLQSIILSPTSKTLRNLTLHRSLTFSTNPTAVDFSSLSVLEELTINWTYVVNNAWCSYHSNHRNLFLGDELPPSLHTLTLINEARRPNEPSTCWAISLAHREVITQQLINVAWVRSRLHYSAPLTLVMHVFPAYRASRLRASLGHGRENAWDRDQMRLWELELWYNLRAWMYKDLVTFRRGWMPLVKRMKWIRKEWNEDNSANWGWSQQNGDSVWMQYYTA